LHAQKPRELTAVVKTSDTRIEVGAGDRAPHLISLAGFRGSPWLNRQEETLPASVEVNGATIPLTWQYRPELGSSDAHHAVFVYETPEPHLRLSWRWEARAAFGPIEHRITIENLGPQ